mgnify:CR=1 FL=1
MVCLSEGMTITIQIVQMKLFNAIAAAAVGTSLAATMPVMANTHVADNLNAADQLFNNGMDGCSSVSIAIMAYNNPGTFGANTVSRSEVARYARRCNLRF